MMKKDIGGCGIVPDDELNMECFNNISFLTKIYIIKNSLCLFNDLNKKAML